MSVVFVMAPLALLLAAVAVAGFVWAARDGQFEDVDTPPQRVLLDDDPDRAE
ncbi:cbb3-type cytochrome oxidase assembly protein CcoS [Botrimarina sp.]|uniref:cbb3-type cytochrome oxidase assembly protein CcoS n=1 Tax=Botrimarina sp. TaxID=2795802 RepID=UPI0032EF142A